MFKVLKDKAFVKRFFSIAIPVMIQTLIGLVVNLVDNLMVGGLTNEAVSAVYSVNQGTFFVTVVGYGMLSGAGIFVQQFFGAKDNEHLKQAFRYKILASLLFLAVILPLFIFGGRYLIGFYSRNADNKEEILRLGLLYMPIIIASYAPQMFTVAYATTFRETGKTIIPMFAGGLALIINATFDAIFIYVFHWGVVGAAIATLMARVVEFIFIVCYAHAKKMPFAKGLFRSFRVEGQISRTITKKSAPLLLNEILWAVGMIMLSLAYSQRNGVLSALAIVYTMTDIFGIVFQGLSAGIGVMVGNSLGAGKLEEAKINNKKLYMLGLIISLIVAVILAILAFIVPDLFIEVVPEQKLLATKLLLVYSAFIPAFSFCVCSYMTLRAGGKTLLTFLLDSCTMWIFVVPTAWLLATLTGINLVYIYIAVQSYDVIKAAVGLLLVSKGTWAVNLTVGISGEPEGIGD